MKKVLKPQGLDKISHDKALFDSSYALLTNILEV